MAVSLADRYAVFETTPFLEDLAELPEQDRRRLERKLQGFLYPRLREQPHHGPWLRKLAGYQPETWRCRIGRWRLFYVIDENRRVVSMTAVDDRKDAYR